MNEPLYHLDGVVRAKAETLEDFDGPLDVILLLLSKNKIEIQDVNITSILEQYLAWLDERKRMDMEVASEFIKAGMKIVATGGTYQHLADAGIKAVRVLKKSEGRPNLIDMIINGEVDLVINTPSGTANSSEDGTAIRKAAIKAHVPYMTTMAAAKATALGIQAEQQVEEHRVVSLQEVHAKLR